MNFWEYSESEKEGSDADEPGMRPDLCRRDSLHHEMNLAGTCVFGANSGRRCLRTAEQASLHICLVE